jgi:hypothetical protein
MNQPIVLFDLSNNNEKGSWLIVDDGVMGGMSNGGMITNDKGEIVFSGKVSLENNGGFSSVRHRFQSINVEGYDTVRLHIKGDGKKYQFRIKSEWRDWYSYIQYFDTSGEWETIDIDMKAMYPTFRGRRLDLNTWDKKELSEIAFLIGNKKAEEFELIIKKIELI